MNVHLPGDFVPGNECHLCPSNSWLLGFSGSLISHTGVAEQSKAFRKHKNKSKYTKIMILKLGKSCTKLNIFLTQPHDFELS